MGRAAQQVSDERRAESGRPFHAMNAPPANSESRDGQRRQSADGMHGLVERRPSSTASAVRNSDQTNASQARADQAPPISHHWPTPSTTGQQQAPPTNIKHRARSPSDKAPVTHGKAAPQ